jgi:hypothetical protein
MALPIGGKVLEAKVAAADGLDYRRAAQRVPSRGPASHITVSGNPA